MAQIDLNDGSFHSFVFIHLFQEALSKFGKSHKCVKSMDYNVQDGLVVIDGDDVVWKVEVNAKVKFPDNLKDEPNGRTVDNNAKMFCVECNWSIKNDSSICSVCEYLKKI